MNDPRSRPDRLHDALSRLMVAAQPSRRVRRARPTAFDLLERRGLMSVASATAPILPAPPGRDEPSPGRISLVSVSGPIVSPYPGAWLSVIRPASVLPGPFVPAEQLPSLPARLGEATEAPAPWPLDATIFSALGTNLPAPPIIQPVQPPPATSQPSSPTIFAKVAMAETQYAQDGLVVREFAFANQAEDQISVRNGDRATEVIGTRAEGVQGPADIKLEDLDGDSIKDMIVANSGANNVLIYPGMAGGKFAPEATGGRGILVGASPAGITIGDIDGDGIPDMVVANRGSNDLSLLMGRGQPADWSFNDGGRVRAGLAPVACLLADVDNDGFVDILVCNSGSNSVSVIRGLGDGRFDDEKPRTLAVGDGPVQVFLGRFDHRPEPELLTVNSRSNDLTLISDFMGGQPTTQTIASGGLTPTSALASDFDSDGLTDLIVANTGDGKLALFQGSDSGLSLTSLVTSPAIPNPTAILVGDQSSDGFDIFAVSAGQDAASILHFDMEREAEDGGFGPTVPSLINKGNRADDDELSAQLVSHGDSAFNLVGVLGFASSRGESGDDRDDEAWDADAGRINRSRVGAQSLDDEEDLLDPKSEPDGLPQSPGLWDEDDPTAWARFVLGLDEALGEAREVVGRAIGAEAFFDGEPAPGQALDALALLDPATSNAPDRAEIAPGSAVDEAIRAIWSGGGGDPGDADAPEADPLDGGTGRVESIPTVSLGLIFAHQLLIRVAPPRRARARKPPAGRRKIGVALPVGPREADRNAREISGRREPEPGQQPRINPFPPGPGSSL